MMKEEISKKEMDKYTMVMLVSLVLTAITLGVSLFFSWWWVLVPLAFWIISMWAALKIEKMKKTLDIKTYKEIVVFMENQNLDEIRKKREKKRDFRERLGLVILCSIVFLLIFFDCSNPLFLF